MFTTAAPAAPTVSASPVSSSSAATSQPRPSRLRDLSLSLRNYTHSLSHAAHPLHHHPHPPPHSAGHPPADSRASPRPLRDAAAAQASRSARPRSATAAASTSASASASASASTSAFPSAFPSASTPPATPASLRTPLSRAQTSPTASDVPPAAMTRTRAETSTPTLMVRNHSGPTPTTTPPVPALDSPDASADHAHPNRHLPSIRLIPHQDPRAARPSLQFPTLSRTLPDEDAIIRVGRYSDRDNIPEIPANVPSDHPVGFKSKVVSRKHCELWCKDSQWYIKDVKSSSGTFLNHIRLSQPNVESKPFKLKDGDIIQLGIDFRGGEEMIFRCVKIRVECNRGWQQALNTFNKQTHQRLRNLAKSRKEGDAASTHTSECSICLMSIAPCQSLFVAPCSHVWHYKCIRPILNGPTWPNFLCPNCRAVTDLEADIEDLGEFEEWDDEVVEAIEAEEKSKMALEDRHATPKAGEASTNGVAAESQSSLADLETAITNISFGDTTRGESSLAHPIPETPQRFITPAQSSSITQPVSINVTRSLDAGLSPLFPDTSNGLTPERGGDGPMTPRNDAGPFVLDGSAGRGSMRGRDDDAVGSELRPLAVD